MESKYRMESNRIIATFDFASARMPKDALRGYKGIM